MLESHERPLEEEGENLNHWCHMCKKEVRTHRDDDWNVLCKLN